MPFKICDLNFYAVIQNYSVVARRSEITRLSFAAVPRALFQHG